MTNNSQHADQAIFDADPQPGDQETADEQLITNQVKLELRNLKARARAKRQLVEEEARATFRPFEIATLAEVLARPPKPRHRVESLIPARANTVVTAPRKVGKTTFMLNLVWSLITAEPFLGRFEVRPVSGVVVLLNFELDEQQMGVWAAEIGIPADRFYTVALRGRANPFRSEYETERLAELLRAIGTEVIIPDPYARAFVGESENDPAQAARFLEGLDLFTRTLVGAEDLIMPAHAGVAGGQERARGATTLEGWADVIINLLIADERDLSSDRFLRAFGRDVEVPEDRLSYHAPTRLLRLSGDGSRKQAAQVQKDLDLQTAVINIVGDQPTGVESITQLIALLREQGVSVGRSGDVSRATKQLIAKGLLDPKDGPRGAQGFIRRVIVE